MGSWFEVSKKEKVGGHRLGENLTWVEDKTTGGVQCEVSCTSVLVGNTWGLEVATDHVPCYQSGSESR